MDRSVLSTGETIRFDDHWLNGGVEYVMSVIKAPILDATGQTVGLQGIFWDVTQEKRTAEKLAEGKGVPFAAVGGSLVFFLVTNLFVWAESLFDGPLAMYPPTWAGLVECYTAAVPFYRTALLGDLFYCGVLFGGLALATKLAPGLVLEAIPVRDADQG